MALGVGGDLVNAKMIQEGKPERVTKRQARTLLSLPNGGVCRTLLSSRLCCTQGITRRSLGRMA